MVHYYAIFDDNMSRLNLFQRPTAKRYKILGFTAAEIRHIPQSSYGEMILLYNIYPTSPTQRDKEANFQLKLCGYAAPVPFQPRKVILQQRGARPFTTILWRTRYMLWYEALGQWIPVLGATEAEKIGGSYLYEAEGDTLDKCACRQIIQLAERKLAQVSEGVGRRERVLADDYSYLWGGHIAKRDESLPLPINQFDVDRKDLEFHYIQELLCDQGLNTSVSFAPRFVLDLVVQNAVSKGESCPISMTPFQECEAVTLTSCFHVFETKAAATWFLQEEACPLCKQKVLATEVVMVPQAR